MNRDRFRREIQVAAQLQHPHIVPLLRAGEAGRAALLHDAVHRGRVASRARSRAARSSRRAKSCAFCTTSSTRSRTRTSAASSIATSSRRTFSSGRRTRSSPTSASRRPLSAALPGVGDDVTTRHRDRHAGVHGARAARRRRRPPITASTSTRSACSPTSCSPAVRRSPDLAARDDGRAADARSAGAFATAARHPAARVGAHRQTCSPKDPLEAAADCGGAGRRDRPVDPHDGRENDGHGAGSPARRRFIIVGAAAAALLLAALLLQRRARAVDRQHRRTRGRASAGAASAPAATVLPADFIACTRPSRPSSPPPILSTLQRRSSGGWPSKQRCRGGRQPETSDAKKRAATTAPVSSGSPFVDSIARVALLLLAEQRSTLIQPPQENPLSREAFAERAANLGPARTVMILISGACRPTRPRLRGDALADRLRRSSRRPRRVDVSSAGRGAALADGLDPRHRRFRGGRRGRRYESDTRAFAASRQLGDVDVVLRDLTAREEYRTRAAQRRFARDSATIGLDSLAVSARRGLDQLDRAPRRDAVDPAFRAFNERAGNLGPPRRVVCRITRPISSPRCRRLDRSSWMPCATRWPARSALFPCDATRRWRRSRRRASESLSGRC